MTRRTLEVEYLRFLSTRGNLIANGSTNRNRPVLMRDEAFSHHFTQKQAEVELGAVGVQVFSNCLRARASYIEPT